MIGLIGKKIGMTQLYMESGVLLPTTVIELGPCPIVQIKTNDGKDAYNALKLGFQQSSKVSKPEQGVFDKANVPAMKNLHEFRVDDVESYEVGSVLKADIFSVGEKVMVTGVTKGRGFTGVTKRHGFKGGDDTHGCRANRIPGSIGASASPARVFKGKKLPGHYGSACYSVRGLEVLQVDTENNVIFVKGAVPGSNKSVVYVTKQS